MARYRLLAGKHVHKKQWFNPGDEIDTDVDLVAKFGGNKFALIESGRTSAAVAVNPDQRKELEALSNKELREFAESEEIDVTTCSNKSELVNTIIAALGERG